MKALVTQIFSRNTLNAILASSPDSACDKLVRPMQGRPSPPKQEHEVVETARERKSEGVTSTGIQGIDL